MRTITVLIEYCKEQAETQSDPVYKYCYKKLTNPQIRVALIVFNYVVRKLAELNKLLQKSKLTPIEAVQFVKAWISKFHLQYLGEMAFWNAEAREYIQSNPDIDTAPILRFIECLCLHLDSRFPDNELKDWNIFETAALSNVNFFIFVGKLRLELWLESTSISLMIWMKSCITSAV